MTIVGNKILPPPERVIEPRPGDPPVFILLASPTWAPWLPDTIYQKVPIGATGQVLTVNADGSIGWSNSASGFANPMTTAGDLIEGSTGGAPIRFPIGTNGQVLTVVAGALGWVNNSTVGFTNPMTTSQDLIVGGVAGAAGRLGIGTTGQVLTVSAGGLVVWQNSAAGFANPMTTLGDLIAATTGGAAQRLAVGANGQVLTVVAGAPAWQNSASGFANPMTAAGDMITGGLVGAAQRLPIGANGQVLTVTAGAPAWASGQSAASAVVFPSGDTTGVTDQANITATWTTGLVANGGEVLLAAGSFYVKPVSGLNALVPPAQTTAGGTGGNPVCIRGLGASTILLPVGAATTAIYYHRTAKYGTFPTFFAGQVLPAGYIRDLVIDGNIATGAAQGIDVGDGIGYDIKNVTIKNFAGVGAIGLNVISRIATFYTEECNFGPIYLNNCTTLVNLGQGAGGPSHDYSTHEFHIAQAAGQDGIVVSGGANLGGCRLSIQGNVQTSGSPLSSAILRLTSGSSINYSNIEMRVETDQALGNAPASIIFADNTAQIFKCAGYLNPSGAGNPSLAGGEFSFNGPIVDSVLSTTWPTTTFPGLGTAWKNLGPNALVCVSGGTVTGININGLATGLITGAFFVPAGASLTVNGTVAPTVFNIVPAAWPQF